jgi:hypothetical protein
MLLHRVIQLCIILNFYGYKKIYSFLLDICISSKNIIKSNYIQWILKHL